MLIPYDGCRTTDKFAEYSEARAEIALPTASLLPIDARENSRNSTQICSRFGHHASLSTLQRFDNDGDALW